MDKSTKRLHQLVRQKWPSAEQRNWWYTKFNAVRRSRLRQLSESQNHRCCYCGTHTWLRQVEQPHMGKPPHMLKSQMATLEHVKAQTFGGGDTPWNLVMACTRCNSERGHQHEAEQFYHIMQNHGLRERLRKDAARERTRRQLKRARERKIKSNKFVVEMAVLFLQVPGLCEYIMSEIEQQRQRYKRLQAERLARQRIHLRASA